MLILTALGDDEYQRLLGRLSPKKPHELPFDDLVSHLRKQFHDNKTLFQRRFEALNFRASPPMSVVEVLDKINILGDSFEFDNFKVDQLKILLTALALSDHAYHSERTILFKLVSEKESCSFNEIREICYAHAERTADVLRVENSRLPEVNAVKQFDSKRKNSKGKNQHPKCFNKNKTPQKDTKPVQAHATCRGCGATNHRRINCPFKEAECRLCSKIGHIAKVCFSKAKNEVSVIKVQGVLGSGHKHRKFANITINGKLLKMQLDTGADITSIGTRIWQTIGRPKLKPYVTSCINVSGHPIRIEGFFYATLGYKDRSTKEPIIVLNRPFLSLIGVQAIDELGLITYDQGVSNIQPFSRFKRTYSRENSLNFWIVLQRNVRRLRFDSSLMFVQFI